MLFFTAFCNSHFYHPVHYSVTNIQIDTAGQKIEYSVRIFADDFTYAINHHYDKDIMLDDGISDMEKGVVTDYINCSFEIIINDSKCSPEYQKIETLENTLWIYFTVPLTDKEISSGKGMHCEKEIISMKIINRLLLDLYPDQTNLTILTINGKQMGYTFNYMKHEAEIDIN